METNTAENMDRAQEPDLAALIDSPGPPAMTDKEIQLLLVVKPLVIKLLVECQVVKDFRDDVWVNQGKRLVTLTMRGLVATESCLNEKHIKELWKALLKDLGEKFDGMEQVKSMIRAQDPGVEVAIAQSLQSIIQSCSEKKKGWAAFLGAFAAIAAVITFFIELQKVMAYYNP